MKGIFFYLLLLLSHTAFSQVPPKLNYQAVVRDANGAPLVSGTQVSFRFTIHDGSITGNIVYTEVVSTTTNQLGLVSLAIGNTNNLTTVNWSSGPKFLQVETDVNNTGGYTDMGTTQLLSVPYALFAGSSQSGPTGATGPIGLQGNIGPTGPTGATGIANTGTGNGSNAATLIYSTKGF